MSVIIKAENISKAYQLGQIGTGALVHDIERWFSIMRGKEDPFLKLGERNDRTQAGSSNVVWSLNNVSFEIEQGDAFGIIGSNGAGKSTLLKIISRVTNPTSGTITGHGRIASLLEVGTGFHPELTGKENVYLNGAILGMRKREIARKFDEIVAFAGVERYIDTPVKRYSSGMHVRLAFAVAAHLDSEILILDEVLAVGDADFQKKCMEKMRDVCKRDGRTILFVSHNMSSIRQLCNKGIVLVEGEASPVEPIDKCISNYFQLYTSNSKRIIDKIRNCNPLLEISQITVNHSDLDAIKLAAENITLHIIIKGRIKAPLPMAMELWILDHHGAPLAGYSPAQEFGITPLLKAGEFILDETITLPSRMNKGRYFVNLCVAEPGTTSYVVIENAFYFEYEGIATSSGRVFEYAAGAGWLFLKPGTDNKL